MSMCECATRKFKLEGLILFQICSIRSDSYVFGSFAKVLCKIVCICVHICVSLYIVVCVYFGCRKNFDQSPSGSALQ